jgi:integrase
MDAGFIRYIRPKEKYRCGNPRQERNWSADSAGMLLISITAQVSVASSQSPRPIPVHGTRKTCGSLLAALDVHPRVAMQIVRHSKIAVTMEIYTEVPSAATREALGKLGQWLDSDS